MANGTGADTDGGSGRQGLPCPDGHANIWVTRLDTGDSRQLTSGGIEIFVGVPVWSPDGQRIALLPAGMRRRQNGYWLVSQMAAPPQSPALAGWADSVC